MTSWLHTWVRFVYESAEEGQSGKEVAEEASGFLAAGLTPAALAALPAEWVTDLHRAAMQADGDLVLNLLDSLRESDGALADALADLVRNFRFDTIVALAQPKELE